MLYPGQQLGHRADRQAALLDCISLHHLALQMILSEGTRTWAY
jgi:hypothetical protein